MVDVNPDAPQLQAQLQAQLRGNRERAAIARGGSGTRPRPNDVIEERIRERQDQPERQTSPAPSREDGRVADLSSSRELEAARARVTAATGGLTREAPVGRTSERENSLRNQPLGQIIDIRV